jgi:hypothetical protein
MPATNATDNVAKFLTGAQRGDVDQMMRTLSADAELVSPMSGRLVFRGHDDLRTLLSAVYGGLKDTRWQEVVGEGKTRVALGGGRIAGVTITDALVLELDDVGRIRRIRPHLRPLLAIMLFTIGLGPKLVRRPAMMRRALSRRR